MKPCYIRGCAGMAITLDGPALSIKAPARAVSWVPLRQVSRIVVNGPVEWATAALLACADHGVPVTFTGRGGAVRAYLAATGSFDTGLYRRLRDFLARPDWRKCYEAWIRQRRGLAGRALQQRLHLADGKRGSLRLGELLQHSRMRSNDVKLCRQMERRVYGWTVSFAVGLLAQLGLHAERWRDLGQEFDLVEELSRLLVLDFQPALPEWLAERAASGATIDDKTLLVFFESRVTRLEHLGGEIVSRFHCWLIDLR